MRYSAVVCVFLLLACGMATPAVAHDPYGPAPDPETDITITYELSLAPSQPGHVQVTATASLPERVNQYELSPPPNANVTGTDGVEAGGDRGDYSWDGTTDRPSITYVGQINGADLSKERTAALDDWGLLRSYTPRVTSYWWATKPMPSVGSEYRIADGEAGHASSALVGFGSHEQFERTVDNATLRLVVPDSATMRADPEAALDSLAFARRSLAVDHRHDTVTGFVAPEPMEGGGFVPNRGVPDFSVHQDEGVDTPENVWIHEYLHTRQRFTTEPDARWLVEGSAEYYAAVLTLEQGNATWAEFTDGFRATEHNAVDLRETGDTDVHYEKGERVVAAIDAEIRTVTDGEQNFDAVLQRLNGHEGRVSYADFQNIVADVAGESLNESIDDWVSGEAEPAGPADPFLYTTGPDADNDRDSLTTADERKFGTHPFSADTDGDGLSEGQEFNTADAEQDESNEVTDQDTDVATESVGGAVATPGADGAGPSAAVLAGILLVGVVWGRYRKGREP